MTEIAEMTNASPIEEGAGEQGTLTTERRNRKGSGLDSMVLPELKQLLSFCLASGVRPLIEETLPLQEARRGFEALAAGRVFGKLVFVNA